MNLWRHICLTALSAVALSAGASEPDVEYGAEAVAAASTGRFAPYFIGSNNHGLTPGKTEALAIGRVRRGLSAEGRFAWGFGAELSAGFTSSADYRHYYSEKDVFSTRSLAPASALTLRELYGEVRYRSLILSVGMKKRGSALYNDRLSSGDFVESNNARPIPQIRIGLAGFRDIPLTGGWLQIDAQWAMGKFCDNSFTRGQFDHYTGHLSQGAYYHYKRAFFRTRPSEAFSVTFGMQSAGQFGGTTTTYFDGVKTSEEKLSESFKTIIEMSIPFLGQGKEGFYRGNTLGSWDFRARYRLRNGDKLYAYFQWPWEDGSGIAHRCGWDGIWGLEWKKASDGPVRGAVLEYIDFRNQGGPIHWAPGDRPGTSVSSSATGRDDYYNNSMYNSYANYGMSLGTPFLLSPLYNLDGDASFAHNRARGVHAAVEGRLAAKVEYTLKYSWQEAWGNGHVPSARRLTDHSVAAECAVDAGSLLKGMKVRVCAAYDNGSLRGDNFGALVSVSFMGVSRMFNK